MIPPRVEVTQHSLGRHWFTVERVRPLFDYQDLRLERTNDERGFPVRWRLLANGRELIDAQSPITFNGQDPYEVLSTAPKGELAHLPNYTHFLDLRHALGEFIR